MDNFKAGEWVILLHQGKMLGSEALDALGETLKIKTPEIVFSDSFVKICQEEIGLSYEFDTVRALELINFEKRNEKLFSEGGELRTDSISMLPNELKVSMAPHWEGRTVPKDSNFSERNSEQVIAKVCDFGSDWTFSSPYKGHFTSSFPLRAEVTEESIPISRLGVDNPILWGGEVIFYEAELDDCGQCKFTLRIRAMADCFYALVRLYLRVDHVIVRIFDTRIFHSYESKSILREFQVKEATYEELRESGFNISPQWPISPNQSDLVFGHLKLVHSFKDKISY